MSPCRPDHEMERHRIDQGRRISARRLRDFEPEETHCSTTMDNDPPDVAENVHPKETWEHTP